MYSQERLPLQEDEGHGEGEEPSGTGGFMLKVWPRIRACGSTVDYFFHEITHLTKFAEYFIHKGMNFLARGEKEFTVSKSLKSLVGF